MQREQRVVTSCRVEFPRLDTVVVAESEDISKHGVFVRTEELLPVGDVVELVISLPEVGRVAVISRVAHLLSPSAARALGRRSGMGFEFIDQDGDGRRALLGYLDDLIEELTPPPMEMPRLIHVLIADPSLRLRERVSQSLTAEGFAVTGVGDGGEAYAACQREAPDIAVIDTGLRVMDGWTLVRQLSNRPGGAIPIVMMSDDGSDMTRLRAYRLGVRDFVHKPFTDEEMVIRLRRIAMENRGGGHEKVVLRGALTEIGLPTLLSLLEFERKSGILVMLQDARAARLFVASGQVVRVEGPTDEGQPLDRLMGLLDWERGNFEFTSGEVVGDNDIGLQTTMLLLEHARQRDEQQR